MTQFAWTVILGMALTLQTGCYWFPKETEEGLMQERGRAELARRHRAIAQDFESNAFPGGEVPLIAAMQQVGEGASLMMGRDARNGIIPADVTVSFVVRPSRRGLIVVERGKGHSTGENTVSVTM